MRNREFKEMRQKKSVNWNNYNNNLHRKNPFVLINE